MTSGQRRCERFCRMDPLWIAQAVGDAAIREDPVVCGVDISRAVLARSMVQVAVVADSRDLVPDGCV
jgi:hypothetical protein